MLFKITDRTGQNYPNGKNVTYKVQQQSTLKVWSKFNIFVFVVSVNLIAIMAMSFGHPIGPALRSGNVQRIISSKFLNFTNKIQ
jgi:hypothetical protein